MASQREQEFMRTKRKRRVKGKGLTRKQKMEVANIVHAQVKPELKHTDSPQALIAVRTGSPSIIDITSINQGLQDTQRTGDIVALKSILVRASIYYQAPAFYTYPMQIVRMIIFQWTQDTAIVTPFASDILQATAVGFDVASPYKLDLDRKYKILFDKQFPLSDTQSPGHIVDVFINKGFKQEIQFGNAANTGINHIFVMLFSSNDMDITATTLPAVSLRPRVRFTDS